MRRFRCDVREAAGLAELFLALDAGPAVVAHYEDEARRVGVATIIADLVHLVAGLALVEQAPETDALEHADALGDGVEWVDDSGRVAQAAVQPRGRGCPARCAVACPGHRAARAGDLPSLPCSVRGR